VLHCLAISADGKTIYGGRGSQHTDDHSHTAQRRSVTGGELFHHGVLFAQGLGE
jgi:hypothetical protein